jgi:uncharacterized protein (TIGR03437 family)
MDKTDELVQINATVNGKSTHRYFISSTQVNVFAPSDAISRSVQVVCLPEI